MSRLRRRGLSAIFIVVTIGTGVCAAFAPGLGVLAQSPPAATTVEGRVSAGELMRVVTELASPRYEGRRAGTNGGRAARAFVRTAFGKIGVDPAGTSGYEQPFRLSRPSQASGDAANLIGAIKGTAPTRRTFVITAHYDHLGVRNGVVYPGADDNASGVAALLAVARYLKVHPIRHPVLVIAFDAEELGLQGAKAFLARSPRPVRDMALNINLDMVSRSHRNEIFAAGTYHSPWLKPVLDQVQRRAAVRIAYGHDRPPVAGDTRDDWTLQSDHGAFHQAGVPFVYFGVEDHPDYHEPTDIAATINAVFFRNVVEMVLDAILTLDREIDL
jgi:Zn-dependent M28 family amino/carboxypeptidase